MSTLKTVNVVHPSSSTNNIVTDANGNVTVGGTVSMASSFLRNRVINGAMEIDQRNAGASVTANDAVFAVDRFRFSMTQSSKGTGQQSTTAPSGFINSLLFTSSAATSLGASDEFAIIHPLEGLNMTDLAWGTANAKTVTLSFWVRSSLTGTFGGSSQNSAANRSYPFAYTISSANTWEYKTVTIPGDTTGTWLTSNGLGMRLRFGLGVGSNGSGTAGSWAAANYASATGATSVVGTNGATFYLTGVQLEVGAVATPFERRQYGTELMLCQRYFTKIQSNSSYTPYGMGHGVNSTVYRTMFNLPVSMRAAQTVSYSGTFIWSFGNSTTLSALSAYGPTTASMDCTSTGITAFYSYMLTDAGSNNSSISFSAEL